LIKEGSFMEMFAYIDVKCILFRDLIDLCFVGHFSSLPAHDDWVLWLVETFWEDVFQFQNVEGY
jgi:hypothetical protein